MLTIRFYLAARRIKKAQQITTMPNPPKDGDEKSRVLASSKDRELSDRKWGSAWKKQTRHLDLVGTLSQ